MIFGASCAVYAGPNADNPESGAGFAPHTPLPFYAWVSNGAECRQKKCSLVSIQRLFEKSQMAGLADPIESYQKKVFC